MRTVFITSLRRGDLVWECSQCDTRESAQRSIDSLIPLMDRAFADSYKIEEALVDDAPWSPVTFTGGAASQDPDPVPPPENSF